MGLPKITDSSLPDVGGLGFVGESDDNDQITTAAGTYFKKNGVWVPVSEDDPLPAKIDDSEPIKTEVTGSIAHSEVFSDFPELVVGETTTIIESIDVSKFSELIFQAQWNTDVSADDQYLVIEFAKGSDFHPNERLSFFEYQSDYDLDEHNWRNDIVFNTLGRDRRSTPEPMIIYGDYMRVRLTTKGETSGLRNFIVRFK